MLEQLEIFFCALSDKQLQFDIGPGEQPLITCPRVVVIG
jgi:hypothetical protein